MVESVFIFMMLLFFILTYIALEKQWLYVLHAQIRAHDRTFWKSAATPVALPQAGVGSIPAIPSFISGHSDFSVHGVDSNSDLSLSPNPPAWLGGYQDFHTKPVEGWRTATVKYGNGWDYFGEYNIIRYGGSSRPSWTWLGFPFVYTQDMFERSAVVDWYTTAYDHLLPDSSVTGLGLSKKPL